MKNLVNISIVLFAVLASSCTTMLYTSIDVLRPAVVTFDKDAKSLLILNNSVAQPSSYGHTNELYGEKKKNVSVNVDSLAIFSLSVLNEEFQENDFFSQTALHLSSVNTSSSFLIGLPPVTDTIKSLAKLYNADVILSLDKIKVNDRVVDFYQADANYFYAMLEANYESVWSITYPKLNKTTTYNFKDTIYWDAESYQRKKALEALPNRYNALIDGALYVGQSTMKKLVPWWDKEDRYFFSTANKYMKQGLDSVYVKNWTSAIEIWEKGVINTKQTSKAKLLYNIAVAYEMSGNTTKAIEYCKKSIDVYESSTVIDYSHYFTVRQYIETLVNRNREIKTINRQLGVED